MAIKIEWKNPHSAFPGQKGVVLGMRLNAVFHYTIKSLTSRNLSVVEEEKVPDVLKLTMPLEEGTYQVTANAISGQESISTMACTIKVFSFERVDPENHLLSVKALNSIATTRAKGDDCSRLLEHHNVCLLGSDQDICIVSRDLADETMLVTVFAPGREEVCLLGNNAALRKTFQLDSEGCVTFILPTSLLYAGTVVELDQ